VGQALNDSAARRDLARLEAFSDGVFAIAITLLVLDIKVPRAEHNLLGALLAQWPTYVGYVGSFFIIGIWWAGHHALLDTIARSDHTVRIINTLHLLCIGLLPFTTALLAEYMQEGGASLTIATVVYVGTLLLAALTYSSIWWYAVRAEIVRADLTPAAIARIGRIYAISALCYLTAFALSFVLPILALVICLGIALYYGFPARRGRPRVHSHAGVDPG
jgi:uncharacterized membrane protein